MTTGKYILAALAPIVAATLATGDVEWVHILLPHGEGIVDFDVAEEIVGTQPTPIYAISGRKVFKLYNAPGHTWEQIPFRHSRPFVFTSIHYHEGHLYVTVYRMGNAPAELWKCNLNDYKWTKLKTAESVKEQYYFSQCGYHDTLWLSTAPGLSFFFNESWQENETLESKYVSALAETEDKTLVCTKAVQPHCGQIFYAKLGQHPWECVQAADCSFDDCIWYEGRGYIVPSQGSSTSVYVFNPGTKQVNTVPIADRICLKSSLTKTQNALYASFLFGENNGFIYKLIPGGWFCLTQKAAIKIKAQGNRIYALYEDGLWYFDEQTNVPAPDEDIAHKASRIQCVNTPNPFEDITTFHLSSTIGELKTPVPMLVEIVIFNSMGQQVYRSAANWGQFDWDGKDQSGNKVAPGIYHYQLRVRGIKTITGKAVKR